MGRKSNRKWQIRWKRFNESTDEKLIERYKKLFGWTQFKDKS